MKKSETKVEHTPTPWTAEKVSNGRVQIRGSNAFYICELGRAAGGSEDAAYIVRAVNSHEELLDLVKRAYIMLDGREPWTAQAKQAIAKAEGSL